MPDIKRQIKFITKQAVLENKSSGVEGFPLRGWSVEIALLTEDGQDVPATCFDKVIYKLHPSFEKRANQTFKKPPFKLQEEGWGEFDMQIEVFPLGGGKSSGIEFTHDLNFQKERYEAVHSITFRNPKPDLVAILKESGGGGDENGVKKGADSARKKSRKDKNVDMEKLADGLQKLSEDDLLQVVQMVHDNKSSETYTKNDVENGEFHVDLYTLPDQLVKMLWDFTVEKGHL
ncbi:SAS complex, SAS5 subunit/transcription initiation factor IID, subunit 14 [Patellaria atrata CBS 101060]|uniref:SAS complex, SAS5 subunit/transcription initiation factor IID, subunit 14 n=1 Tax=Patellaria atrata CBS 101060 TaxID=1346257 RepID=A0A9P4S971_9PEZI|nr:SAS complex, SAS5 subunit/transcription initiation factor IID, subunit 14 [Patellaria atrata CBS 101060]